MYKIYTTEYKPFWINNENKPDNSFFENINFNWIELNNTGVNYSTEQTITLFVENDKFIYFKIYDSVKNKDYYFHFESVLKRMDKGVLIKAKLDTWVTFNLKIVTDLIANNKVAKIDRGTIRLSDFVQYPIYNEELLNNSWKKINNPNIGTPWKRLAIENRKNYFYKYDNTGKFLGYSLLKDSQLIYKGLDYKQKNKIVNRYLVVYNHNDFKYLLFPDFTFLNEAEHFDINGDSGISSPSYTVKSDNIASLFHLTAKIDNNAGNSEDITFFKLNRKKDLENILTKSKLWSARTDIFWFYGPDLYTLIEKFKLNYRIYNEGNEYFTFCLELPYYGQVAENVFNINISGDKRINKDMEIDSYFSNAEKTIFIGNKPMKYKQLINNDYLLFFNQAGFKLVPTNQTNKELLTIIDYGDILPTNKDQYLQYVNSIRNSVNTGYWTNSKESLWDIGWGSGRAILSTGLDTGKNLYGKNFSAKSYGLPVFDMIRNTASFIFKDSLMIEKMEAKYKDIFNSLSAFPETSNLFDLSSYLIPQNWLLTTGKDIEGVVPFYFSVYDWLDSVKIDINNTFLYYGFSLNNFYSMRKIANQPNNFYIQFNNEWLNNNLYSMYGVNLDWTIISACLKELSNGIRIWKTEYSDNNFVVDYN